MTSALTLHGNEDAVLGAAGLVRGLTREPAAVLGGDVGDGQQALHLRRRHVPHRDPVPEEGGAQTRRCRGIEHPDITHKICFTSFCNALHYKMFTRPQHKPLTAAECNA